VKGFADIARETGEPITAVYRRLTGGAKPIRASRAKPCVHCGSTTDTRGSIAFCPPCRGVHFAAQQRAGSAVRKAIRIGMLKSPALLPCADCGGEATQYDHRNYAKPLEVEPVCRSCNARRGVATLGLA
jgi:Zn finger protein HypA/HybF involved in hydrogenase expression